jgi:hypothetical protein
MFRIFRRAQILLVSILVCINLIAARPLPPPDIPDAPTRRAFLQDIFTPLGARLFRLAPTAALAVIQSHESRPPRGDIDPMDAAPPQSQPAPEAPRPTQASVAPAPLRIAGDGPWMHGSLVAQTERLDLYVGKKTFSADQVAAFAPLLEQLLRDDEIHFGTRLKHRISLGFYSAAMAPKRGVRGMAYTDSARVELFYRPYEDPERAATVAAHELGHHLEAQRYGEAAQRRADTILHEGMATWIAGARWLAMCGATSWKERARQLRDSGVPLRLLTAEHSGADNAYELWASFVDFLAQRYGWDTLDALYYSGRGRAPGSSNYKAVLGKSLDEVSDAWREWVNE